MIEDYDLVLLKFRQSINPERGQFLELIVVFNHDATYKVIGLSQTWYVTMASYLIGRQLFRGELCYFGL